MEFPSLNDTAIAFGSEQATLWPTLCAIQALLDHHPHTQLDLHILHTTIADTLQQLLSPLFQPERAQLHFHNLHQKTTALRLHTHPRWQTECFFRCYLPVLFRDRAQLLWLDHASLITGPLEPLLHRFPRHAGLGAVADPVAQILRQHDMPIRHLLGDGPTEDLPDTTLPHYTSQHLGLRRPEDYFNSGMLLLRPGLITPTQINRCFTLATRPYLCPGSDILNQVFHDHVHLLPERWNFLTGKLTENLCLHLPEHWKKQREEERLHRSIIQFPEGQKPWLDDTQPGASTYRRLSTRLEKRLSRVAPALIRSLCSQ